MLSTNRLKFLIYMTVAPEKYDEVNKTSLKEIPVPQRRHEATILTLQYQPNQLPPDSRELWLCY